MCRIELLAFDQQFGQDSRRGHGEDAAEGNAQLPTDTEKHDQPGNQDHAHENLKHAEAKYDAFHCIQFGQREFEANREHQEDDAEFGQILGPMDVVHQVQRVRPDDAADKQVAKHRRQIETPKYDHGHNRGTEQKKDEGECAQGRV